MKFLNNLKFAWKYVREQKWKLVLYVLCGIITVVIGVVVPVLSAKTIVYLTDNKILQVGLVAVAIFLAEAIGSLMWYLIAYFSQSIYKEAFTKLQVELGENILKLHNSSLDANSSGVFIQRITGDTSSLADVFNVITGNLTSIITNLGIYVAVFVINKWVFFYVVLVTVVVFFLESNRIKRRNELNREFKKVNEKTTGFVSEVIRGVRDIKMLNAERSFVVTMKEKVTELNENRYKMQRKNSKYQLAINFLYDFYDLGLILFLIFLLSIGEMTIANALIIYNYSYRMLSIVHYFGTFGEYIKDFNLSAERIFALMDNKEFQKETFGTCHIDKVEGNFEFKNVRFAYDDEEILKGVNFKIKANETVAFVGKSGAGKTTIFNLLCKMYEPTSGKITIDGVDIKSLDKDSIRGNITIISQDPYIFNLSIKDNLKLVKKDLTDEEMIEACRIACLHDFIEELPKKYDTIIGEGGVNLSGGQKQRLAIARALIQKTEIILFDEATSSLDNVTQAKIQEAIDNMKSEYTILIIAHRLSTIINADRIIFLNDGKIEAEGTHKELLNKSKAYKYLYESEIGK